MIIDQAFFKCLQTVNKYKVFFVYYYYKFKSFPEQKLQFVPLNLRLFHLPKLFGNTYRKWMVDTKRVQIILIWESKGSQPRRPP